MALPYSSALQTFLAEVQDLSSTLNINKAILLKVNGVTENILFIKANPQPGYGSYNLKGYKNQACLLPLTYTL